MKQGDGKTMGCFAKELMKSCISCFTRVGFETIKNFERVAENISNTLLG